MLRMGSNKVIKYIVIVGGFILAIGLISGILFSVTTKFGNTSQETADLGCGPTSNPPEEVIKFGELSQDKQLKVKQAIEKRDPVKINGTQEDFFETHNYIRYRNETYICGIVNT